MPFQTTNMINYSYYHDECQLFIIYGLLGYGKTTFATKVLSEVLKGDWEEVKKYLVFKPEDFIKLCMKLSKNHQREKAIVWDDAGLWLFAMKQNDPLITAVTQYLNVARTNWAAIIFTTPTPSWITYKIRNFPQHLRIKIIKAQVDKGRCQRLRIAKAYRTWIAPDFKKTGVRTIYTDYFDATMPTDFYNWYKPIREDYALTATTRMEEALSKLKLEPKIDPALTRDQYTI